MSHNVVLLLMNYLQLPIQAGDLVSRVITKVAILRSTYNPYYGSYKLTLSPSIFKHVAMGLQRPLRSHTRESGLYL